MRETQIIKAHDLAVTFEPWALGQVLPSFLEKEVMWSGHKENWRNRTERKSCSTWGDETRSHAPCTHTHTHLLTHECTCRVQHVCVCVCVCVWLTVTAGMQAASQQCSRNTHTDSSVSWAEHTPSIRAESHTHASTNLHTHNEKYHQIII